MFKIFLNQQLQQKNVDLSKYTQFKISFNNLYLKF